MKYLVLVLLVLLTACGTAPTATVPPPTPPGFIGGQGPITTAVVIPTPTLDPTVAALYSSRQATAEAARRQACQPLISEYASQGRTYNPRQDVELTVIEISRFHGVDPSIHSGYADFLSGEIRKMVRACQ